MLFGTWENCYMLQLLEINKLKKNFRPLCLWPRALRAGAILTSWGKAQAGKISRMRWWARGRTGNTGLLGQSWRFSQTYTSNCCSHVHHLHARCFWGGTPRGRLSRWRELLGTGNGAHLLASCLLFHRTSGGIWGMRPPSPSLVSGGPKVC